MESRKKGTKDELSSGRNERRDRRREERNKLTNK